MTALLFTPSKEARAGVRLPGGAAYVSYAYDEGEDETGQHETGQIVLHVRIAMATDRPLLISGDPGVGKSTLARDVALCLGWRYYQSVITSRTQARDLQYRWDPVRRLADVQQNDPWAKWANRYVDPEPLWWAFAPGSAERRGLKKMPEGFPTATDQAWWPRGKGDKPPPGTGAVILLDEIDKADPDVPNDLLVALDERHFTIHETGEEVEPEGSVPVLVFITTNGERDLPQAFLRRCVTLRLERPKRKRLEEILVAHVADVSAQIIKTVLERYEQGLDTKKGRKPATAELIDATRAAQRLLEGKPVEAQGHTLERILDATLWKGAATSPAPR